MGWRVGFQVGQYGADAAVVFGGFDESELGHDVADVGFDGAGGEPESSCDAGVGAAFGHQREYVVFSRGEGFERVGVTVGGDEAGDDSGSSTEPPFATRG
jgi:hypothetical protein